MNNYCTNCGEKLESNESVCKKCNTPVIDLNERNDKSVKKKHTFLIIMCIIGLCIFIIMAVIMINRKIANKKINELQTKYIEPYLNEHYAGYEYTVDFRFKGKCVTYGNCSHSATMSCDNPSCIEYEYLDAKECTSYYFIAKIKNQNVPVSIIDKKGADMYVVPGRNIDGTDYVTVIMAETTTRDPKDFVPHIIDLNPVGVHDVISKYPYESDYHTFITQYADNQIDLDSTGTVLKYYTSIISSTGDLYLSGQIANPHAYTGSIDVAIKYYNSNYSEIGQCEKEIKLLGDRFDNIALNCQIADQDLKDDSNFEDIAYYKMSISSFAVAD